MRERAPKGRNWRALERAESEDVEIMSLAAAARWLGTRGVKPVSRNSLYAEIARGKLKARELMPRVWAVRLDDLQAYAADPDRHKKTAVSA